MNNVFKKKKTRRNEPCPCGSGKKYRKCCWNKDIIVYGENEIDFENLKVNGFEKYIKFLTELYNYKEKITNEERDGLDLEKNSIDYFDYFYIDELDLGYPDSYFTCFITLDFHYGKSKMTTFERYILKNPIENLSEDIKEAILGVKSSYPGFFYIKREGEKVDLIDIYYKNIKYENVKMQDEFKNQVIDDDVWFTRVFDDGKEKFIAMEPIIFENTIKINDLIDAIEFDYFNYIKENNLQNNLESYIKFNKELFFERLWMLIKMSLKTRYGFSDEKIEKLYEHIPYDEDGNKIFVINIYFRINENKKFNEKLFKMKNCIRNGNMVLLVDNESLPIDKKKKGSLDILGGMMIFKDELVCDAFSFEKAEKMLDIMEKEFGNLITYDGFEREYL